MTHKTKNGTKSQPLRKTAYISKALIAHKDLSHQAFRIACVMLAHKESCEPTIAEAAIMARVGRDGRRKATRALLTSGVCAPDGSISYEYRKVREQYARINPATIMRDDLSDVNLRVFAALSGFADRAGFAFPKYSTLSTCSTVKARTLRRSMSALGLLGLVSEQRRANGSSWKFVNEPLLFQETDAPDLPVSVCQEVLAQAMRTVGRPVSSRSGPLNERKLNYAHQTLLARKLLFLSTLSTVQRKNQKSATPDRAGAFGPSSPRVRTLFSTRSAQGLDKTSQEAQARLIQSALPSNLAMSCLPLAGPPTADITPRLSLTNGHPCDARLTDHVLIGVTRQGSSLAQAEACVGVADPLVLPVSTVPRDDLSHPRIKAVRNSMQSLSLHRLSRPSFTAWDCNTFRAIDAGALDPAKADSVREGFKFRAWNPVHWIESYAYEIAAGMTSGMKNRGHGLFKFGKLGGPGSVESEQPQPEIMTDEAMDVLCELNSETRKRFGESAKGSLPSALTGKQRKQIKTTIQKLYTGAQITKMIRVLVWDWEEVRSSFWPKMPAQRFPNIQALVVFADNLVQFGDTGVPSTNPAKRGRSGYAERYLTKDGSSGPDSAPPATPRGLSLDDL